MDSHRSQKSSAPGQPATPAAAARPAAAPAAQARPAAPARAAAAPPPARPAAPPPRPAATAAPVSPEHLAISPQPSGAADGLEFDWEPLSIGTNRSFACTVTTSDGTALSVSLAQGMYRRSFQGDGVVKVPAIPPAAAGTAGSLTATTASGVAVTYSWQWQPGGRTGAAAAPPASKPGLLSRLFGRTQAAPATATATAKAIPALSVAERLGTRAALAAPLKFFGQEAVGQRFAFILDRSGSMSGSRWNACTRELEQALRTMPGHAEFFVVLFSQGHVQPPGQSEWTRADRDHVDSVVRWVKSVHPSGGTYPASAFQLVFGLNWSPDVVYFLTDGEIDGFTPAMCAGLRGSAATIVNTIALENGAGAEVLKGIAGVAGGQFVHVPSV